MYLRWSMFDDPQIPGSGYKYMDRQVVQCLDRVVMMYKMSLETSILIAYCGEQRANRLSLPPYSPFKAGLAVKIKAITPKKRFRLVKGLLLSGIDRIGLGKDFVYFDRDTTLKPEQFLHL